MARLKELRAWLPVVGWALLALRANAGPAAATVNRSTAPAAQARVPAAKAPKKIVVTLLLGTHWSKLAQVLPEGLAVDEVNGQEVTVVGEMRVLRDADLQYIRDLPYVTRARLE